MHTINNVKSADFLFIRHIGSQIVLGSEMFFRVFPLFGSEIIGGKNGNPNTCFQNIRGKSVTFTEGKGWLIFQEEPWGLYLDFLRRRLIMHGTCRFRLLLETWFGNICTGEK